MDKEIDAYNGIIFSHKKGNFAIWYNTVGPWGHYAKWNKSEENNTIRSHSEPESNKERTHSYKEEIDGCQRKGLGMGEIGKGGQKAQNSSYKTNRSWYEMYSLVTIVNNTVFFIWKLLRE